MNFKKTIAKSLVVAMALGMVPMANLQTAKAAQATVAFEKATGFVKSADSKFWGIAKEAKEGKGTVKINNKFYKITNIQELAEAIDAYSVFKGKAGIIAAGVAAVPNSDWGILELPAVETTLKVQVVASTGAVKGLPGGAKNALGGEHGYLVGTVGKKDIKEVPWAASKASIQVKLNDSSWQTFNDFFGGADKAKVNGKLRMLGQTGSTLYFRLAADDSSLPSKEVKIKLSGQPKAPAVKIDVNKDTTTIKKGMEWQIVESGKEPVANQWKTSTEKKGLSLIDLNVLNDKVYDVLVRNAASVKKLASKVGRVTLNKAADALTVPGNINGTGAAIKESNKDVAIVEATLAYDITKGATIKNVSTKDLEYALVTEGGNPAKFKWNTLKASKDPEKKPTKANLKYSAVAKDNTWKADGKTKLFVRLAGTKQDKNNIATKSGVSAGGVVALKNIEQKFKFKSGTAAGSGATVEVNANSTTAAIKIATGTAAKITVSANISKVVNSKGGSAKIKATTPLPKGVTIKAGKINAATGDFDITIDINKNAFKETVTSSTAAYSLQFEGVKDSFKITIGKK